MPVSPRQCRVTPSPLPSALPQGADSPISVRELVLTESELILQGEARSFGYVTSFKTALAERLQCQAPDSPAGTGGRPHQFHGAAGAAMIRFSSERERIMVLTGALVAGTLLYMTLVLQPLVNRIRRDEKALPASRLTLERAQRLAGTYLFLKSSQARSQNASAVQEVERITRELGLQKGQQVADLKDLGNNTVQLRLDDLDGSTLVRLLDAVQRAGLKPDGLKMRDPQGAGGSGPST